MIKDKNDVANDNINGKDDWYLPSLGELSAMYNQKTHLESSVQFEDGLHWSSTEYDPSNSWANNMTDNQYETRSKVSGFKVRAVRRVAIN